MTTKLHTLSQSSVGRLALACLLFAMPSLFVDALAQTSPKPPQPTASQPRIPAIPDADHRIAITSANLTDRPYTPSWPKPSFPSSERAKKQFTIEYVYRYAQSDYTPAVELAAVKHSDAQTDTPEHTLIALVSALKTLDYDWWLSLWDSKSQQLFLDEAKNKKQDAAYWKPIWQNTFVGKPATLTSRLETVHDIVLEFRVGDPQPGKPGILLPVTLRLESGRWLLTRELSDSMFVPSRGAQATTTPLDFVPLPAYSGVERPPIVSESQRLFFENQTRGATSATEFAW